MSESNSRDVHAELEQLRQELERITTETNARFQTSIAQIERADKISNTTISILRQQREAAHDQIVQQGIRITDLMDTERNLRNEIASLQLSIADKDTRLEAYKSEHDVL